MVKEIWLERVATVLRGPVRSFRENRSKEATQRIGNPVKRSEEKAGCHSDKVIAVQHDDVFVYHGGTPSERCTRTLLTFAYYFYQITQKKMPRNDFLKMIFISVNVVFFHLNEALQQLF